MSQFTDLSKRDDQIPTSGRAKQSGRHFPSMMGQIKGVRATLDQIERAVLLMECAAALHPIRNHRTGRVAFVASEPRQVAHLLMHLLADLHIQTRQIRRDLRLLASGPPPTKWDEYLVGAELGALKTLLGARRRSKSSWPKRSDTTHAGA